MQQTTVAEPVLCRGVGLHSGAEVEMMLRPAEADTGIRFVRIDSDRSEILASPEAVRSTTRATTLASTLARGEGPDSAIGTVEHLLAALYALGIHNARIEVSGPEIPALDGSARPLLDWIRKAGCVSLDSARREIEIVATHEIRSRERSILISPAGPEAGLRITYSIDFPHRCIGRQSLALPRLDEACFEREVAGARTFGFVEEVEALRAAGLGKGGSFENTIVLDEDRVLNPEPLRWPDEFVRHKVLDLVGDLALFGATIHAQVEVDRGGHALHHELLCALRDEPGLWRTRL